MADNDILFNITAIDHYKAEMDSAYALAQRQVQADQAAVQMAQNIEAAEAKRAATSRNVADAEKQTTESIVNRTSAEQVATEHAKYMADTEQQVIKSIAQSSEVNQAYIKTLDDLKQKYSDGQITQQQYIEGLNDLKKSAQDSAQGFTSFQAQIVTLQAAMGIAGQVLDVFKKAWDFSKEGAAIQRIGAQFNQVAADFGVNGEALVAAMDNAARGTVDDEELMQTATRALTQGVITNAQDLTKFVEIARASAVRFGGDTTQALQSILYATEVGAQRSLKATIGVVDFSKAYDDLAQHLGKRKQDLTDEEQLQARVNAVLEKGQDLVKKVGTAGDDAATKMQRFETRVADLGDQVKSGLAGSFLPYIDALDMAGKVTSANVTEIDKLNGFYEQAKDIWGENSVVAEGYRKAIALLTEQQQKLAQTTDEIAVRQGMGRIRVIELTNANSALVESISYVERGARNQSDAFNVLDSAMDTTTAKSGLLAAQQKLVATEMSDLKSAMAGALQGEFTNFNTKQDDLATKAAKVKEELDKLEASQGKVATSTKKHALTANEATLAQLELAKAQRELDIETAKGTLSADEIAAAQAKLTLNQEKLHGVTKTQITASKQLTAAQQALKDAQAELNNNTDPLKQAKLAVEVDNLKEKLGQATGAVVSYIDNSKRIKELQGQYDEINKEIEANVAAHEKATKTILFGYAEQQLAVDGLTGVEADALDALAVKWGLKSQEDVAAMKNIRTAAQNLSTSGDIEAFTASVGANLDKVNADYAETQGKIEETGKTISAVDFLPPAEVKVNADTKPAEQSVQDLAKTLLTWTPLEIKATIKITPGEEIKAAAGDTIAERAEQARKQAGTAQGASQKSIDANNAVLQSAQGAIREAGKLVDTVSSGISTTTDRAKSKVNDMSTSVISALTNMALAATGDLNGIYNLVNSLPTYKELIYHIKVTGAEDIPSAPTPTRGAQHGADFVVPPNPRGGSGDYFPVMAAPGERVVVTPAGRTAAAAVAKPEAPTITNNTYNLYDALAAKQVTEQQRLKRIESIVGAM